VKDFLFKFHTVLCFKISQLLIIHYSFSKWSF